MSHTPVTGEIVETMTLVELSSICRVPPEWIADLVDEGLLEPTGRARHKWQFHGDSLGTVARAYRLQRDLGLNVEGIALVLSLLDEAEELRARVRHLEAALAARD